MDLLALALIVTAVVIGRRHLAARQSGPDLGPSPTDGFSPEAMTYYERRHEAEEQARYREAYEAGIADACAERRERLVEAATAGRPRYPGGATLRRGFTTTTGVLGAIVAFPALLVAFIFVGLLLAATIVGNLAH